MDTRELCSLIHFPSLKRKDMFALQQLSYVVMTMSAKCNGAKLTFPFLLTSLSIKMTLIRNIAVKQTGWACKGVKH